jgi:hypothetical protein
MLPNSERRQPGSRIGYRCMRQEQTSALHQELTLAPVGWTSARTRRASSSSARLRLGMHHE